MVSEETTDQTTEPSTQAVDTEDFHDPDWYRENYVPSMYRDLYSRAQSGKSRQASIKAMCLECQGWEGKEARVAVKNCTNVKCPLHSVRPYVKQQVKKESAREERKKRIMRRAVNEGGDT